MSNTSIVDALASGNQTHLLDLAGTRIPSKPYTVSEYNHPAPNDFQSEAVPLMMSFAALQDWNGVFWFADKATINPWFDTGGNPAKELFFPAASAIFRMGEIGPVRRAAALVQPDKDLLDTSSIEQVWSKVSDGKLPDLLQARLFRTVDPTQTASSIKELVGTPSFTGSGAQIVKTSSGPEYIASGRCRYGRDRLCRRTDSRRRRGACVVSLFGNNFASITLTANDGKPIGRSRACC